MSSSSTSLLAAGGGRYRAMRSRRDKAWMPTLKFPARGAVNGDEHNATSPGSAPRVVHRASARSPPRLRVTTLALRCVFARAARQYAPSRNGVSRGRSTRSLRALDVASAHLRVSQFLEQGGIHGELVCRSSPPEREAVVRLLVGWLSGSRLRRTDYVPTERDESSNVRGPHWLDCVEGADERRVPAAIRDNTSRVDGTAALAGEGRRARLRPRGIRLVRPSSVRQSQCLVRSGITRSYRIGWHCRAERCPPAVLLLRREWRRWHSWRRAVARSAQRTDEDEEDDVTGRNAHLRGS